MYLTVSQKEGINLHVQKGKRPRSFNYEYQTEPIFFSSILRNFGGE